MPGNVKLLFLNSNGSEPGAPHLKIAGLTTRERILKACHHASVPLFQFGDEKSSDLLIADERFIFDFYLISLLAGEHPEGLMLLDDDPPRPMGLARIPQRWIKECLEWDKEAPVVHWDKLRERIPQKTVKSLNHYHKHLRKVIRPTWFDPRLVERSVIEQHWLNAANKGTNEWVAKHLHVIPQNWITRIIWPYPWITPNLITLVNLFFGLYAVACFARADFLLAAIFVNIHRILDGVDGKLARTTFRFTKLGYYLDHVGDYIAESLWYLSMGWGLRGGWGQRGIVDWPVDPFLLSWVMLFFYYVDRCTTGYFSTQNSVELHDYRKWDRWIRTYAARVGNNMLLILIGALLNQFPATFLTLFAYMTLTSLSKVFRFIWIRTRHLQTDLSY